MFSAYKIRKKLYEDIIGTVYSFSSDENKNTGQIKILHEEFAKQDDLVQAFHKCAEKSCSIRNQNYISALSHGEENGTHFIVLETCNLTPLSILLKKTDVLSISDSIEVIETLANTLRQAHIDEVIGKTGLPAGQINSALICLRLKGLINQLPGNLFFVQFHSIAPVYLLPFAYKK